MKGYKMSYEDEPVESTPEQQTMQDKVREGVCKALGIKIIPSSAYKTKEQVEKEKK